MITSRPPDKAFLVPDDVTSTSHLSAALWPLTPVSFLSSTVAILFSEWFPRSNIREMAAAADMDDDGFNFDDYEEDESVSPPSTYRGAASIQAMVENRQQDRLKTKKRMANLRDTAGAPSTVYIRELWTNRFRAYLTKVRGLRFVYRETFTLS